MNAAHVKSIHDAMLSSKDMFFEDDVLVRYREVSAWVDYAEGFQGRAVETLRSVAEKEEATGNEPSGIPAREMLADLLLDAKQPEQALKEYELDLKFSPNRFNGLYGAGRAAEMSRHPEKAHQLYAKLISICAGSESQRPELAHAKGVVSQQLNQGEHPLLTSPSPRP